MTVISQLSHFTPLDAIAVLLLLVAWGLTGWRIEHPSTDQPSVSLLMGNYRRDWMVQMVTRQPRIFDASILSTLRQGITFFASACLISIGGALALIGNTERLVGVAEDLSLTTAPAVIWEVKILVSVLIITNSLLKFIWAHRLFGYCAVLMGATPNDPKDPQAYPRAAQAAEINVSAARAFNRGLRTLYFALASLAWLLGALPLMIATLATVIVLWRREFRSTSRTVLMQGRAK